MKKQPMKTKRHMMQGNSGIRVMLANPRRLELAIVAAGLLVLLLSSRPPKSGNAGILTDRAEMAREMNPSENVSSRAVVPDTTVTTPNAAETWRGEELPPIEVQPRMKRIGVVDARSTGNPKYRDLMYGEIAVRWVWNGQKIVPQKVCIVDEGNGVSSVWSFDQSNGAIVSEIQQPVETYR